MIRFFKSRKPGPTELTWEEKNPADYRYRSEDIRTSSSPSEQKNKSKKPRKEE